MFIPRHPVIDNMLCHYAESSTFGSAGVGNVIAYAGSVVYLDSTATNQEPMVKKMAYGVTDSPFGFLMQKVKVGYHQVLPTGYMLPGDAGSSDVIAQPLYNTSGAIVGHKAAPVGIAHLGIYDTVHYTCTLNGSGVVQTAMLPGANLYPAAQDARVTNSTTDADGTDTAGERCSTTVVARVMAGASVAKCQANIDNTTLTPIRIKLLI